jgi:hypothetical protein
MNPMSLHLILAQSRTAMLTKMEKTIRYTSAYPLFCLRLATTQFDSGIGPKISSVSDQAGCLMCQCCLLNVHDHICLQAQGEGL